MCRSGTAASQGRPSLCNMHHAAKCASGQPQSTPLLHKQSRAPPPAQQRSAGRLGARRTRRRARGARACTRSDRGRRRTRGRGRAAPRAPRRCRCAPRTPAGSAAGPGPTGAACGPRRPTPPVCPPRSAAAPCRARPASGQRAARMQRRSPPPHATGPACERSCSDTSPPGAVRACCACSCASLRRQSVPGGDTGRCLGEHSIPLWCELRQARAASYSERAPGAAAVPTGCHEMGAYGLATVVGR